MGDVAVYVVLGGGPVRGSTQDSKRFCLTGGAAPISCGKRSEGKDRCGLQRRSGPVGAWWPSRSCPAAGVERHHMHAMQLEQFNLGNNGSPITMVPPTAPAGPEPVATLLFRFTGVDIEQCPVCHAGRLRLVAVFRPGHLPAPALDTS